MALFFSNWRGTLYTNAHFKKVFGESMNYEIDAQNHELEYLLEDLRDTLRRIDNFNSDERRQRLRRCAEIVQHVKTVRSAYQLELKAMDDEELKREYQEILKDKTDIFKNLLSELEAKKHEIDREQLQASADEPEENVDYMTTQQVIKQGDKIQDKTQEAVDRMKRMVGEAEEIGVATAHKMDVQMEQMGQVSEALNDVEYNVKRAQQTARTLARNALSDRCIQVLCVGILVCIFVIIGLSATK